MIVPREWFRTNGNPACVDTLHTDDNVILDGTWDFEKLAQDLDALIWEFAVSPIAPEW